MRKHSADQSLADDQFSVEAQSLDALAQAIAKQCVYIIRGCLREEEWIDAEHEFTEIVAAGIRSRLSQCTCSQSPSSDRQ